MKTRKHVRSFVFLMLCLVLLGGCGLAKTSSNNGEGGEEGKITLKLSHQWPKPKNGEGDFRAVLAEKFASMVEERTNGAVQIRIYPASSLVEAKEQYDALLNGAIDLSVYPLDYAGGKVPQFSITLMPALVRNHAQAQAWETAEIGKRLEEIAEENGIKILAWIWNAGAIGSKGEPIVSPEDVKDGMVMRAAGSLVEDMLRAAGASITSMSSSEMYSAFQTGVLDAGVTSNSSFASYKLYEQVQSYTTSLENTFWFMFEPLIMSMDTWNSLTPEQQDIFVEVGNELQDWAYEASKKDDERVAQLFAEKGVNVVDMNDEAFQQWVELAKPIWEKWANNTENGQELLDLALQILNEE